MSLILVFIAAVSLSMDAFSLSLAYGTLNMYKSDIKFLSLIVGIYHFVMPLIGLSVGSTIINLLPIKPNALVSLTLLFIGIEMIYETFKEDKNIKYLSLVEMLLFGFAVSIDSFILGLGLKVLYKFPIVAALIFSIVSLIFTYMGLMLGKKINDKIGSISTIFGGIVLIFLSIFYYLT